jgi:hypothetical protein
VEEGQSCRTELARENGGDRERRASDGGRNGGVGVRIVTEATALK